MRQDWTPPVSLQHPFYSDSQPGEWEVVSMLHFPTWIADSFLKDNSCPFQPLLLSPLPSLAPNNIFSSCPFIQSISLPRGLCTVIPSAWNAFPLDTYMTSAFTFCPYFLTFLTHFHVWNRVSFYIAYAHLAYKILGLLPKRHHLMGPYWSHLLNIPCTFIWVELQWGDTHVCTHM